MKHTFILPAGSRRWCALAGVLAAVLAMTGCQSTPKPGTIAQRTGDEIMVAGQLVHTGTPIVLWMDPGGYDAYRVDQRFSAIEDASFRRTAATNKEITTPNRYGLREKALTPEEIEKVRGGGWDLGLLQNVVDQFVIHFDDCGTSKLCFKVLQDERDLSVHFMLDIDGTIYQTLDLKERAWHATTSNTRSVGIEIANIGTSRDPNSAKFQRWYKQDVFGTTSITIPPELGDGGVRTVGFLGHPAHPNPIKGNVQGMDLYQYDYTPEQYAALIKLTATLCKIFPKLQARYPTDAAGKLIPHKLPDAQLNKYEGVLGHYHIQTNKDDPGPAFDWEKVIITARDLNHHGFNPQSDDTSLGASRQKF